MEIRIAIHNETGARYFVLDNKSEMKHPETRDWVRCVIYTNNVIICCREERDFNSKFTLLAP